MFRYEYVKIATKAFFTSVFTQHRDIINEYAGKGYRYIGFIPTKTTPNGGIFEIDLIFEKEEE